MKLRGSGATAAIGRATDAASRYADAPYGWVTRIGIVAATSARHNRLRHVGAPAINARVCSGIRIDRHRLQLMRAAENQYPETEKQYPCHVSNFPHRAPMVFTAAHAAAAC